MRNVSLRMRNRGGDLGRLSPGISTFHRGLSESAPLPLEASRAFASLGFPRARAVCPRQRRQGALRAGQPYATALIVAATLSTISPIWFSLMMKGGVSSIVSPDRRNMIPASWKEYSSAL